MPEWVFLLLLGGGVVTAIAVLASYQGRQYRRYLTDHIAETNKITNAHAQQLEISRNLLAQHEAQVAVLTRIADALEKR